MTANVFDRSLLPAKRKRAARNFSDHSFLFEWVEHQLYDRLSDFKRTFPTAVQIGMRGTLDFETHPNIGRVFGMDICDGLPKNGHVTADEEFLPFANESLDLVIALLTLHSVNDLPGALIQIRRALKPDGLFLGAMLGGETLFQLRDALGRAEMDISGGMSPRIAPFADKQQMGGLMQRAGFALPVVDSDIITVTYSGLSKLYADLRGMGESNIIAARAKKNPSKALFDKAEQLYIDSYAEEDGKLPAAFEVIFLTGWSPHESQQKPLKPGSAEHSLAEKLGTKEIGAGEKV